MENVNDVIAWLDSLHETTEDGSITNRKWAEAQRAAEILRDREAG